MTRTLLAVLAPGPDAVIRWGLFDDENRRARRFGVWRQGDLPFPATAEASDHVWVVVPGTDVIARNLELPALAGRRLRAAAAFALEDELAVDVDSLHLALGEPRDWYAGGQRRLVAGVSRAAMEAWMARLHQAGLTPEKMVPDFLAIPVLQDAVSVVLQEDLVLVRGAGDTIGFSVEHALFDAIAAQALADAGTIHLVPAGREGLPESTFAPGRVEVMEAIGAGDLLAQMYLTIAAGETLSLLQGVHAPRQRWAVNWPAWRRAAAMALATAGLGGAVLAADGIRMTSDAAAARQRAEQIFRDAVPGARRVVNPQAQLRAHLGELKAGSANLFLRLCQSLFPAVAATADAEIKSLRFEARGGSLTATLALPSYGAIEEIKGAITARGAAIEEGGARQDADRILFDIVVRLP